jgi:acetyl-CoA carboxylase carboxyltransferase component
MSVSSPKVTFVALSEEVTAEQLGGWEVHARTGQIDIVVDTDEDAIAMIRRTLGYLLAHRRGAAGGPPRRTATGPATSGALPVARNKVYDVRRSRPSPTRGRCTPGGNCTAARCSPGSCASVAKRWASSPATLHKGGATDGAACDKSTEFIVLCDTFNPPIVLMADTPGHGRAAGRHGRPGKIMNLMSALQMATVPKLSVILRKSYGQAYLNMGGASSTRWAV